MSDNRTSMAFGRTGRDQRAGQSLEWNNLSFHALAKDKSIKRTILNETFGTLPSASLTAILGTSGSGKSSLLNILAGRMSSTSTVLVEGAVSVDGQLIDPVDYRKNIAYVMQDDCLLKTATPREALTFSATLRLGVKKNKEQISEIVNAMLAALGLEQCADTFIGDQLSKGISGGERKRTAIGVELVTSPSLVFLDEPTSGLDAYAAYKCIELLKKISVEDSATVLCTIHQPSSEVFQIFDNVIVLGTTGRIVYGGPASALTEYYEIRNFPIPLDTNPADHALFVLMTNDEEELEKANLFAKRLSTIKADKGDGDSADGVGDKSTRVLATSVQHLRSNVSSIKQIKWLLIRETKNLIRDKPALIGRYGATIFLNILFGIIFLDAGRGDDADQVSINNHYGALTLVTISTMFGSAQPALLTFPSERPLFLREYSTGTYGLYPYVISKVAVEVPTLFLQIVFQSLCVYFLIGFQGSYILIILSWFALAMAVNSTALLAGSVITDVKTAAELTPLLFVPQLLFSGFFVATQNIPVWLRWAQWLCSLKYTLNLLILIEFVGNSCNESAQAQANCDSILQRNDINTGDVGLYIGILVAIMVSFRIIAAILLSLKANTVF
ncbi:hypothetical protein TrCOL_g7401 [Triparma columacea]|uniref:ABC transporter domain-containing protein n=1 Tax=Triparma columacea TaxID=722753 RepID=A0A9W7FX72_9STRA|nr:hypothetical protein TrCOL_g7401 [Triparma columacea]